MSRTFRRTKPKKHFSHFSHDYLTTVPDEWNGVCPMHGTIWAFPSIWKEGAEYDKAWHWYHGDCPRDLNRHGNYIFNEPSVRMRNKQELCKWRKCPDYEVFTWDQTDCADVYW